MTAAAEQLIVVRGGMAYTFDAKLTASAPVEDFLDVLHDRHTIVPVFLPHADRGCAAYAKSGTQQMFLMYLEPQKRTFTYNWNKGRVDGQKSTYMVVNPHWYLALFFNKNTIVDGYALVAKRKIQSPEDGIGPMPVPNIYEGAGRICWGTGSWQTDKSPIENIPACVDYFLKSEWNADICAHFKLVPPELRVEEALLAENLNKANDSFFKKWEKLSAEKTANDLCSLDWKATSTLRDLMEYVWRVPIAKRRIS